jgi:hypothetical protein
VKRQVKEGIARNNVQTCQKSDRLGPKAIKEAPSFEKERMEVRSGHQMINSQEGVAGRLGLVVEVGC